MISEAIDKILDRVDLTPEECGGVIDEIIEGSVPPVLTAAFLTALRQKGETAEEIYGAARVMRQRVTRIPHNYDAVFDNCGTGGDGASTFNISTTTSFVLAGAGIKMAKHGNRSISSKSGSADVLQALGVNIDITPEQMQMCLERVGMGFLFAPALHPAMKAVAPVRKELGIRTIFNILGPLTNPAFATHQMVGVFSEKYVESIAQAARKLGVEKVGVVYCRCGTDELTTADRNVICYSENGDVSINEFEPSEYGFSSCRVSDLAGGNADENALITTGILQGEKGPRRDTVVLNAAFGIYIAGLVASIQDGIVLAGEVIDSGRALEKLNALITCTNGGGNAS